MHPCFRCKRVRWYLFAAEKQNCMAAMERAGYLQQDVIWFQVFRRRPHEITPAIPAALGGRGRAVALHSSLDPYSPGQGAHNGEKRRHQQAGCRLDMELWGSGE